MQFTLRFLLLMFPLIAACLAIFDWPGLVIGFALAGAALCAGKTKTRARAALGVVLVLVAGFPSFLPAVGDARRAARRVACVNHLKWVTLSPEMDLPNYHDCSGRLPPEQEYDNATIETRWRPSAALPLIDENGDKLRPTAGSNPVHQVHSGHLSLSGHEWRGVTVDEACQAIHVPMPSGSLASRLLAEESPCVLTELADGEQLLIPRHAPATLLRAALLGDRAKQRELGAYLDLSRRLRWFDYLTLLGMVACWIAMIHACPRERSKQSLERVAQGGALPEVERS